VSSLASSTGSKSSYSQCTSSGYCALFTPTTSHTLTHSQNYSSLFFPSPVFSIPAPQTVSPAPQSVKILYSLACGSFITVKLHLVMTFAIFRMFISSFTSAKFFFVTLISIFQMYARFRLFFSTVLRIFSEILYCSRVGCLETPECCQKLN
jgi:hypothetical protein